MGTNLRLDEQLARALRDEAARRGRSQQAIVREAISKELGLASMPTPMQRAVDSGTVLAAEPFRDVEPVLTPPQGISSPALLDRDDR